MASRHALDPNPCGRRRARTRPRPGAGSAPSARSTPGAASRSRCLATGSVLSSGTLERRRSRIDRASVAGQPRTASRTTTRANSIPSAVVTSARIWLAEICPWPYEGDDPKRSAAYSGDHVEAVARDDDIRWIDREIDHEPSLDGR